MSQNKKLYDKLNKKPTPKDIKFEEVDRLLRYFGFERRQPFKGSSHFIYTHKKLKDFQPSIVKSNPLKVPYVRNAISAIQQIIEISGGDDFNGK